MFGCILCKSLIWQNTYIFLLFPFGRAMELCLLTTILLCYLSYAAAQSCAQLRHLGHQGALWAPAAQLALWTVIEADKYKAEKETK